MSIPERAVVAARKAVLADARTKHGPRSELTPAGEEFVRLVLEAAAPVIGAQAWDEGYEVGFDWACWADRTYDPQPDTTNPYSGVRRDYDPKHPEATG